MARRRLQLEVWNAANTSRLALFTNVLSGRRTRVLAGEESLTASVPLSDPAVEALAEGSVLRLQREGSEEFTLWRLQGVQRARTSDNALRVTIAADALWMDLIHGHVRQAQTGGRPALLEFGLIDATPRDILADYIIPGYEGQAVVFEAGDVDEAVDEKYVDLAFSGTSPLHALRMLEAATQCEAAFRASSDGQTYYIDLLERIGSETGGPELAYRKNLRGLDRTVDYSDIATRLRIQGSGDLQLSDAEWRVLNIASNVITLGNRESAVPVGTLLPSQDRFGNPVWKDGALVGMYYYVPVRETGWLVTASSAQHATITLQEPPSIGGSGLAVEDVGYFALDAAGTQRLDYLEDLPSRALHGVRVGPLIDATDVPDAINLIEWNSDFGEWVGGVPSGWDEIGSPAVSETQDPLYVRHGLAAAHVVAGSANEGLRPASGADIEITENDRRPYLAIVAALTVTSGVVKIRLRNITTDVSYPQTSAGGMVPPQSDGGYQEISQLLSDEPLPAGTYRIEILSHGGAAEWYMDAAMVTHVVGDDKPGYLREPAPQVLWHRLANELLDRSIGRIEYRIDLVNLHRVDPEAFIFERLDWGDTVKVRDPDIGIENLRLVDLHEDIVEESAATVAVAADRRHRRHDRTRPPVGRANSARHIANAGGVTTGTAGGGTGATGATGPQGPQGPEGDPGPVGSDGMTGATGPEGPEGTPGDEGPPGATGVTGQQGPRGGARYTFSTTTTDADPGNGTFRFNNATIASVTQIFIDLLDAGGADLTAWIDAWDDSSSFLAGYLIIQSAPSAGTTLAIFSLTTVTTATGYRKIAVTYVSGALPANGEACVISFHRTGDIGGVGATGPEGDPGANGDAGPIGATGATGPQGLEGADGDIGMTGATGQQGATGATGALGPQGPSGDPGITGATGATGVQGPQGVQGLEGDTGPPGATGATGVAGHRAGATYNFSTTTADADPGFGNFRFNNASIASVTQIFIDELDAFENVLTVWLDSLDDSTNPTIKGHLIVQSVFAANPAFAVFAVTGVTVPPGYRKIAVTYISGTAPGNLERCALLFTRSGNIGGSGATGATGPEGDPGANGDQGATGATGAAGGLVVSGTPSNGDVVTWQSGQAQWLPVPT